MWTIVLQYSNNNTNNDNNNFKLSTFKSCLFLGGDWHWLWIEQYFEWYDDEVINFNLISIVTYNK
jgi:hypothetical protein